MRKFFRIYICTIRKDLSLLALGAVLFIFMMDLILLDIPAPNRFFYVCGRFFYGVSMAYVASFVFYFLDVHCRRQMEKQKIYNFIGAQFKIIISDGKSMFKDLSLKAGKNVAFEDISDDDIIDICSKIDPLSESTILQWGGNAYLNWIEYLEYMKRRLDEYLMKIQPLLQYAEVDFVRLLVRYSDSGLFSGLNIISRLNKEGRMGNKNFRNGYEQLFISYIHLLKESEQYYQKEFVRYSVDR